MIIQELTFSANPSRESHGAGLGECFAAKKPLTAGP